MPLRGYFYTRYLSFELKKRDQIFSHKLGCNRATDKIWKLACAHGEVLFNLHDADLIFRTFRLNWENIMGTAFINPNVHLISLDLTEILYSRTKMILKRIACNPGKDVQQPVVS